MPEAVSPGMASLLADMEQVDAAPLWSLYLSQLTREPRAPDDPRLWSWRDLAPLTQRALAEVPIEHAERRVLLLKHPAFAPGTATTTHLQGGLQILKPGDHAPPHRHAAAAIRFVIEGQGAVTIVDSQSCEMAPGDLILTPAWCWHEHVHSGSEPIVWFDGLDVPLVQGMATAFLEFGPAHGVPVQVNASVFDAGLMPAGAAVARQYRHHSPRFRYDAAAVRKALAVAPPAADGSRLLRYTNPVHGGPVMSTLDCYALRLSPRATTRPYRSTSNAIAVVVNGSGETTVGDRTLRWAKNDVFSLPHWLWVAHRAEAPGSQLFLLSDLSLLDALGYLRTEYAD